MSQRPVLIVDDDVDIREILAEALADRGFEVVTAANGLEALRLLSAAPHLPSVILLDLMMPVMDGYRFLEERRRSVELASVPVAIMTAAHRVDRSRVGGDEAIITKPIDLGRLVQTIEDLRSQRGSSHGG